MLKIDISDIDGGIEDRNSCSIEQVELCNVEGAVSDGPDERWDMEYSGRIRSMPQSNDGSCQVLKIC